MDVRYSMAYDRFFRNKSGKGDEHDVNSYQRDEDVQDFVRKSKNDGYHDLFDPFGTLEDTSLDMFQRMDDMLSQMFSSSLASFGAENFSDDNLKERSLRSVMLKDPNDSHSDVSSDHILFKTEEPTCLIDSDIDDKVAKLGSLWQANLENDTHKTVTFKKFSSIRTVRLPDGSQEEHRSMSDSKGNTTTTVRRTIGDQSHEITTHSDTKGLKEKQENYTNLDENDLLEFEKRWQNIKTEQVPPLDHQENHHFITPRVLIPPTGDPTYLTLFKKFFGI